MFRGWSLIIYGTAQPAYDGDTVHPTKYPSSPTTPIGGGFRGSNNNYLNNNNMISQKSQIRGSKKQSVALLGRKNKIKGKTKISQKNITTSRANNGFKKLAYQNQVTFGHAGPMTTTTSTMRPHITLNWNNLNQQWIKQSDLSVIPQKTANKAPKQVKENFSLPASIPSTSTISRIPNFFDHYEKIQHVFPEFHPYQESNNNKMTNHDQQLLSLSGTTIQTTPLPQITGTFNTFNSSLSSLDRNNGIKSDNNNNGYNNNKNNNNVNNNKPSRENSKLKLFLNVDIPEKKSSYTSSSNGKSQSINRLSTNQRNEKGTLIINQFTAWFYC